MRKVFFILFLVAFFCFPKTEAFAQGTIRNVPACTTEFLDPKPVGRTSDKPPNCTDPSAVCYKVATAVFADCYRLAAAPAAPGAVGPAAAGGGTACKKLLSCNDRADSISGSTCTPSGGGASYPANVALDTANLCPVGMTGSSADPDTCICGVTAAAAGTGATAKPTPCLDPKKCTSGQGLRCNLSTGQPEKPGAPGTANSGIYTAIGCVPTQPQALVEGLIKYATYAGAGVAFLLMILGALQMITSEGNPESIKHAQERFYSAIIGLLLIIFSVLLMQVIGVDVLDLPGFAP